MSAVKAIMGGIIVFTVIGMLAPKGESSSVSSTDERAKVLGQITISSFRWSKEAFGSVMEASFVINNRNSFPIKDSEVTCLHAANSGSVIDKNTRTVYERVQADGSFVVDKLNMGFIHSQATHSRCEVTNFHRA